MDNEKKYQYVLPAGFVLRGGKNDYVIEQVLGKGGFGVTYKVRTQVLYMNIKIDAFFAVKEFFPDICSREADNATIKIPETKQQEIVDGKNDFINEGKKLQEVCNLNPNIVKVNEVFEANGTAYYVMEYLEGGDLRKMVRNNGKPLSEKQMLDVMVPIGNAVQCLHRNRMLHLDIKPDNAVMRIDRNTGSVEPVLIDFGISTHFNIDGTPTSKTPSQGISPGYSPIEQYAQVNHFDPRIDVYAFCATCFYLLTGKDPIVAMEITPDYVKKGLPGDISTSVAGAIERGMTMSKNARTATISEVLRALQGEKTIPLPKPAPELLTKVPDIETTPLVPPAKLQPAPSPRANQMATKQAQSPNAPKPSAENKAPASQEKNLKKLLLGVPAAMCLFSVVCLYYGFKIFDIYGIIIAFFIMLAISGYVGFLMNNLSQSPEYKNIAYVKLFKNIFLGVVILVGILFIVGIFVINSTGRYSGSLDSHKLFFLLLTNVGLFAVALLGTNVSANKKYDAESSILQLRGVMNTLGSISVASFIFYLFIVLLR